MDIDQLVYILLLSYLKHFSLPSLFIILIITLLNTVHTAQTVIIFIYLVNIVHKSFITVYIVHSNLLSHC